MSWNILQAKTKYENKKKVLNGHQQNLKETDIFVEIQN